MIGIVFIGGYLSYNKILAISLARSSTDYHVGEKKEIKSYIMTILECQPGKVPFLPSVQGKITIEPYKVELVKSGKLKIINGDSIPHKIGIGLTQIEEMIKPGDAFDLSKHPLPFPTGVWAITCDGIDLGPNAPTIRYQVFD